MELWDSAFYRRIEDFAGKRVLLITNKSGVDSRFRPLFLTLKEVGVDLTVLAPEHGLYSDLMDQVPGKGGGGGEVAVIGAYRENGVWVPSSEDYDLFVFALPDVGTRVYTYIQLLFLVTKRLDRSSKPLWVLDYPNPLGGKAFSPRLCEEFASFVGLTPIPLVHGLTPGELALFYRDSLGLDVDLEVFPFSSYSFAEDPWFFPSPHMPSVKTALVYPGAVMFEGTNLSEGRGTTRPFEILGAPWLNGVSLCERLIGKFEEGVRCLPLYFVPQYDKHKNVECGGVLLDLSLGVENPVLPGLLTLYWAKKLSGGNFVFRGPPYEYEKRRMAIDVLWGSEDLRKVLEEGEEGDLFSLAARNEEFEEETRHYRMYDYGSFPVVRRLGE